MAKIIKLKDLINENTWNTRKFGEPLPTMADYKTAYNKKRRITEAEPPKKQPPPGGGAAPGGEDTSKELKIDIPNSPFEPDINQIKDQLKNILGRWKIQEYPSDGRRWREYYKDISKLYKQIDGESDEV